MLPPIPQGLVPVTAQNDPVKPTPVITAVSPTKENTKGGRLGFENDESSTAQERARDEQRRQHQRQREALLIQGDAEAEAESATDEQLEKSELSRKGLWVDIKV
ncbi:MAG TPA: aspartate-semialdehyde dehydrogenase [Thiopseudomonas sp.]|nr:aspartate-semialdehyde dehydrogenase [Thiopseudomonas sp.]